MTIYKENLKISGRFSILNPKMKGKKINKTKPRGSARAGPFFNTVMPYAHVVFTDSVYLLPKKTKVPLT